LNDGISKIGMKTTALEGTGFELHPRRISDRRWKNKRIYSRRGCLSGNLSQRFSAPLPQKPYELFKTLALQNPEPFAAYLNTGDFHIVSTSPERFLKASGRYIETRR